MHFLLHRDIRQNDTIRILLIFYLSCTLFYLLLTPFYEHSNLGYWPKDLILQVKGNADLYIEEKNVADIVLDCHIRLFIHSLIGIILVSIAAKADFRFLKSICIVLFLCPIFETASLFLLSFSHFLWAYLKFGCHFVLWATQLGAAAALLRYCLKNPKILKNEGKFEL